MFDIGWAEMMVIAVVAIVVVGPKELPGMLRTAGNALGKARRMGRDFQRQFDDALRDAELHELKQGLDSVKSASPRNMVKSAMSPVSDEMEALDRTIKDPGPSTPTPAKVTPAKAEHPATDEGAA